MPTTATNGRKTSGAASKDYLSKLFNNTVERAKNEFTTIKASTLRRSKRNINDKDRVEEKLKRASWNSNVSYNQSSSDQKAVGFDKMDIARGGAAGAGAGRNYEEGSDRSTSTKSSQLTSASSASEGGTAKAATGAKKKAVPLKPTTILSLEDRDLVIIDGNDIKESVQNESEVIVVDPPSGGGAPGGGSSEREVDLMDILGKDWPALAGDTAHVLNAAGDRRSSSGGQVMKPNLGDHLPQRNKSMNIMSHLKHSSGSSSRGTGGGGATLPRTSATNGASGSTNSSFESSHSGSNASSERRKSE